MVSSSIVIASKAMKLYHTQILVSKSKFPILGREQ